MLIPVNAIQISSYLFLAVEQFQMHPNCQYFCAIIKLERYSDVSAFGVLI